jgi:hypothetical protein
MVTEGSMETSGRWRASRTVRFNALTTYDDPNSPKPPTTPWVVEFDVP